MLSPARAAQVKGLKNTIFTKHMTSEAIGNTRSPKNPATAARASASHTTYKVTTGTNMLRIEITSAAIPRPLAIVNFLLEIVR
jgi:hypothetical protein